VSHRPWVALLGLALLAPAACSDDGPGAGEARLQVDGEAVVERADGDREVVTDGDDLGEGDRVTLTSGRGELLMADGVRLELREGRTGDDAPTSVVVGAVPVLESGDLLVTAPDIAALEVDGTSVWVSEGAARLRRGFGMSVASYDAAVLLDSAGQERDIPALRQMAVPDLGRPPSLERPLAVDETDPWDRRYLGAAIDLGQELETLAAGLFANLPPDRVRSAEFFRFVLPGLDDEPAFTDALIDPARDSPETLLGAAISDLGQRGDFDTRWEEVFAFRDAGATWGLVALDQAVRSGPLVEVVEEALGTGLEEATFALPPGTTPSASPPTAGPAPVEDPSSPGTTTPPPASPTTQPPASPTPSSPPPTTESPTEPLLEPLVEPVEETTDLLGGVVDGLVGGLLGS
jgi:hypothetical protein